MLSLLLLAVPAWGQGAWRGPITLGVEVQDSEGEPVAGARVQLEFAEVEPYTGPPPLTTDASGRVEVFGLAEGLWRVQVEQEDFSPYLVVLRLDVQRKKVLITAGPLVDATGPPLEVEFVKSVAAGAREKSKKAERKKDRKEDRRAKRRAERRERQREKSGRISEQEAEEAQPEPTPQPTVRTVPEEERQPETPAEPTPAEPEAEAREEAPAPEPSTPAEPAEAEPAAPEPTPPPTPETAPEAATEAAPEPVVPAPTPPPAPTLSEPPPPAVTETAPRRSGPPTATNQVRSYQAGTCSDCKPGEAATSAVAAAGEGDGDCPAGYTAAVEQALDQLTDAFQGPYTGPLTLDGEVVAVASEDARQAAQQRLGPWIDPTAPCQVLMVVLAPEVKFTGYRYEARQGSRGGDCLAGQDCPIGAARWPDHPRVERTDQGTFVWAVFLNRGKDSRQAELTIYFDPTP